MNASEIKPYKDQFAVTWPSYVTGISSLNGKEKMISWCFQNLGLDDITLGFFGDGAHYMEQNWVLLTITSSLWYTDSSAKFFLLDRGSMKAIIVKNYTAALKLSDFIEELHTFNVLKRS